MTLLLILGACVGTTGDDPTVHVRLSDTYPNMVMAGFGGVTDGASAWIEVQHGGATQTFSASGGALAALDDDLPDLLAIAPGLPPDTQVTVVPHVQTAAGIETLAAQQLTTGSLPDDIVPPLVEGSPAPVWSFTATGGVTWAPLLLAPDGTPAWWYAPAWQDTAIVRTRPHPDGLGVTMLRFGILAAGADPEEPDGFVTVSWDGQVLSEEAAPGAHHDFLFMPDGSRVWLAWDEQLVDGQPVLGDALLRTWPDGRQQTLMSTWDVLPYDATRVEDINGTAYWTHCNALALDPWTGRILVSVRNYGAILALDPDVAAADTGSAGSAGLLWRFSAVDGDFDLAGEGLHPAFQHGIDPTSDGFLLFDNGRPDAGDSRIVRYRLDEDAGTAEQLWSHHTEPPHYGLVLGDVQALPDGRVRADWSALGVLEDFDEGGQVSGSITTGDGAFLGFLHIEDALFPVP